VYCKRRFALLYVGGEDTPTEGALAGVVPASQRQFGMHLPSTVVADLCNDTCMLQEQWCAFVLLWRGTNHLYCSSTGYRLIVAKIDASCISMTGHSVLLNWSARAEPILLLVMLRNEASVYYLFFVIRHGGQVRLLMLRIVSYSFRFRH